MIWSKLRSTRDPHDLLKLHTEDFSILWICDFWDGPKSGLISHDSKEYWFEIFEENADDHSLRNWYRRFGVIALTGEQLEREHEIQKDFDLYVGSHPNLRPKDQWHLFYDRHRGHIEKRDYGPNEVVAWFEK